MSLFGIGGLGAGFGRLGAIAPGSVGPASIATNSLLLASASSQYLSATGKTNINQQKFTYAFWLKTSSAVGIVYDFSDGTINNRTEARLTSGTVVFFSDAAGVTVASVPTTATVNDGNWHHVVVAVDTTQATATNRVLIYIDGAAAALGATTYPPQNTNLLNNFAATYDIGSRNGSAAFFNGNLAQVYYIDGQQLTPSSFITGTPGVPKTYSGSYTGNFDFFLNFSNGGSLGADSSGEGNNWTPQNSPTQSSAHP